MPARKKSILTLLTAALFLLQSGLPAQTLHALLVGDTHDRSIGGSVVVDLKNIEALLRRAASSSGMRLSLQTLQGSSFRYDQLLARMRALRPGPDDTLFFYYSGHGSRTSQKATKWPDLYIRDNSHNGMPFDLVISTLGATKPRLLIAMTDSCNSYVDRPQGDMPLKSFATPRPDAFQKLFRQDKGYIFASSSKPGEYSFGNDTDGGLFTSSWLKALELAVRSSNPDWNSVMQASARPIPVNFQSQSRQSPQYAMGVSTTELANLSGGSSGSSGGEDSDDEDNDDGDDDSDDDDDSDSAGLEIQTGSSGSSELEEVSSAEEESLCSDLKEFVEGLQSLSVLLRDNPAAMNDRQTRQSMQEMTDSLAEMAPMMPYKGFKDKVNVMQDGLKYKNNRTFQLGLSSLVNLMDRNYKNKCD
jgi:hypothetical protein